MNSRRVFLGTGLGALFLGTVRKVEAVPIAQSIVQHNSIELILSKDYKPQDTSKNQSKLLKATMDYVTVAYPAKALPFWNKPLKDIELERRIEGIIARVYEGISAASPIHGVDPVWTIAQLMAESCFYEFAVSPVLAVGVCQFMRGTAGDYKLLCTGDEEKHTKAPYQLANLAKKEVDTIPLKKSLANYRKEHKPKKELTEKELRSWILQPKKADKKLVKNWDLYEAEVVKREEAIRTARREFYQYLDANFAGRDMIKNKKDAEFLYGFDQRVTYRTSVPAMVEMMAKLLDARNGNILTATSSYNAGLGNTKDFGQFAKFGRIPSNGETPTYISHIIANYLQIQERL